MQSACLHIPSIYVIYANIICEGKFLQHKTNITKFPSMLRLYVSLFNDNDNFFHKIYFLNFH